MGAEKKTVIENVSISIVKFKDLILINKTNFEPKSKKITCLKARCRCDGEYEPIHAIN